MTTRKIIIYILLVLIFYGTLVYIGTRKTEELKQNSQEEYILK